MSQNCECEEKSALACPQFAVRCVDLTADMLQLALTASILPWGRICKESEERQRENVP